MNSTPGGMSDPAIKQETGHETFRFTNSVDDPVDLLTDNEEDDTLASIRKRPPPKERVNGSAAPAKTHAPAGNASQPTTNSQTALNAAILAKQKDLASNFKATRGDMAPPGQSPALSETPVPSPSLNETPGPERDEDDVEARYNSTMKEYRRKKMANQVNPIDEIQMIRMESEYETYLRKKAADEAYDKSDDEQSGLFVSERATTCAPSFAMTDLNEVEAEDASKPRRGRKRKDTTGDGSPAKKARKPTVPKKGSKAPNYSEEQMDEVLLRARTKADVKTKKPGRPKGSTTSKRPAEPTLMNARSLFGGDVFRDTAANAHRPSQPTFNNTTRRGDALKQLMASVPADAKKLAKSDSKYLDQALKELTGHSPISPSDDGNWIMKGMRTSLKPYQVMGVSFMRKRESGSHSPKGGILADEMGLGKTIMMLANIINGKSTDAKCKTTLIVASPALIAQWFEEIRSHCKTKKEHKHGIGTVIMHRPGSRIYSNDDGMMLQEADIVLTTYNEVMKSFPKPDPPTRLVTSAQKEDHWNSQWENDRGVLHRVRWHRIVLDEASAIKNHLSHTSKACRALDARFTWAISGTPVQNSILEFYPYFHFLKHPLGGSYKIFKENFQSSPDDEVGRDRLVALLSGFMIRRTHIDLWMGSKLLDLPAPHEHTLWLEFNDVERQIYEIVRKRFIARVNRVAKSDDVTQKSKFSCIWTMLIRLRQLTASVLLIFDSCLPLLEREDYEKLNTITQNESQSNDDGTKILVHLRNKLRATKENVNVEGGIGASVLTADEAVATGIVDIGEVGDDDVGGKHGRTYRIGKYFSKFKHSSGWQEVVERARCCGCRQEPLVPYVTSCSHIFCLQCLQDLQHHAARRGLDMAKCSECGEMYTQAQPCEEGFVAIEDRPTPISATEGIAADKKSRRKKNSERGIDWLGLQGEILPSAKSIALKAQILEWIRDDPEVKILVYTQWIPMVEILKRVCQTEGWDHLCYTGRMSHEARTNAIGQFSTKPETRILLASLKCGGLGLNITAASKVILIDPWWNSALEQQAFCRVFRIGQQKSTTMLRLVVKNTVDEAMMQIKERKKIEIDEVMDHKGQENIDMQDLMRLFGEVGEDAEGRPFIVAEDDGLDGPPRIAVAPDDEENVVMGNEA